MNNKELKQIRDKEILRFWEERKSELTMRDLMVIYHLSLGKIHHILKGRKENKIKII